MAGLWACLCGPPIGAKSGLKMFLSSILAVDQFHCQMEVLKLAHLPHSFKGSFTQQVFAMAHLSMSFKASHDWINAFG